MCIRDRGWSTTVMTSWKLPAFGVFLAWGLWSFVPKLTVRYIDPRSAAVYEALGALLVALGIWFSMQFRLQTQPTGMALAFATGVLGLLGALCFLVAVARGPVS